MPRPIVPPKGYPPKPVSLGDHLRKRRLDLGLRQAQLAERIGVTESTVWNWEHGTTPAPQYHARIIELLGYQPKFE
jgi:transcriptional regulator with XRE-family HTH domain